MNRVLFSSASDHWATPRHVYEALDREFGFTFDPCPLRSETDGLGVEWNGSVFCNPPYSNIAGFLKKATEELAASRITSAVFLLPSRTDTRWFHDYCMKGEIRFIKGRLKFGDAKNSAPFPSMVVIFRGQPQRGIHDSLAAMQRAVSIPMTYEVRRGVHGEFSVEKVAA